MFCGECGSKLKKGAKFCGECGTSVIEKPLVTEQQVIEITNKKSHKLLFTIIGVFILVFGIGYYYLNSITTPAKIVSDYMNALKIGDNVKLFEIYGLSESDFITLERFIDIVANEEVDFSYEILSTEIVGDKAIVDVLFIDEDNDRYEDKIYLTLDGKKYLIFNNWEINELSDIVVNDVSITVPSGSLVEIDGVMVSDYEDNSNCTLTNCYNIPSMFPISYDVKVTYPNGIVSLDTINPGDYNTSFELFDINVSDMDSSIKTSFESDMKLLLNGLYTDVINKSDFSLVSESYANGENSMYSFLDDYNDMISDVTSTLSKVDFTEVMLYSMEFTDDGLYEVILSTDYNYELLIGEEVISKDRDSVKQTILLDYKDGKYVLAGVSYVTTYFSRY